MRYHNLPFVLPISRHSYSIQKLEITWRALLPSFKCSIVCEHQDPAALGLQVLLEQQKCWKVEQRTKGLHTSPTEDVIKETETT